MCPVQSSKHFTEPLEFEPSIPKNSPFCSFNTRDGVKSGDQREEARGVYIVTMWSVRFLGIVVFFKGLEFLVLMLQKWQNILPENYVTRHKVGEIAISPRRCSSSQFAQLRS